VAGCSGYSGIKTVAVSAPATPGTPSGPAFDYDGSYTISWSSSTGAATYTLQERLVGGSWATIHDAAGTSKAVTQTSEGNREYQVRACSGAGCSGYSSVITVAVALPPSTTGATPGAIPGSFSVGTQGDARYTIPIVVPVGTGGLKPSLALSYNHQAGNGLAGMRWTLSGISAITRCPQTVAQDGAATALNYSDTDRYCLNGQRLVNFDGNYHADDTEYRTEIESFQRIVQDGTLSGGGAEKFYVDHGNGLRSYFGETADSRIAGIGTTAGTWFISRTVDQFGNTIAYGYDNSVGTETVPETITWTGNTDVEPDLPPRYAVTITYEARPTDDVRGGYDSGGKVWSRSRRIDEIEVTYDDGSTVETIATYALAYSTPLQYGNGRSLLEEVSVCRGSECLPETLFTVAGGAAGWYSAVSTNQAIAGTPLAGDWNGDGRTDLFVSISNEWNVYRGKADGLLDAAVDTNLSAATSPSQARVLDFDGDGLTDLMYKDGSSNWKVAPSNGETGFDTSIDTGVSTSINPILQDHDGDGLTDLVYVGSGAIAWYRNAGGSFEVGGGLYTAEASVPSFSTGAVDSALRSLDLNGDGRADLIAEIVETVCNPNDPYDCYNENKYYLLLADGNAYNAIHWANLPDGYHYTNFRVGDFDGDGLGDFLFLNQYLGTHWQVTYSTGGGGLAADVTSIPVTNPDKVLIADYDGDGRDDLLRPDGDYWRIHRANASGLPDSYTDSLYSPSAASALAFAADLAGSGHPQIVRTQSSYWYTHLHHTGYLGDVVTAFTDGLGRTIEVDYESLAQTDSYTLDLDHDPSDDYVRRYGGTRHVVTTETHDDGVGGTRAIAHEYDTAFVNTAGRGWQSFRSHTITDAVEGVYWVTEYSQAFPTDGMVESAELSTIGADDEVDTSDDRTIRSVDPEPAADDITGTTPPRQFVRVEQTTTLEKEVGGTNDGDLLRTIVDDPEYDTTYGFVTDTTRTVTQPGVTGDWETTTDFDRGVIETSSTYCLGLPGLVVTTQTLLDGTTSATRIVEQTYNSNCSLDTVTDLSEASDTTKQLVRELDYDAFGNVETVSEYSVADGPTAARTTTFVFDDDGHFPETVTVGGVNLTTTLEFDPMLGVRTSVTGPDGLATSFDYDAFGRLILEERPAGSTDFTYSVCASSGCFAPNAAFFVKAEDSTGATSYSFFDAFERPVGSDSPLAGGKRSRGQVLYRPDGRVDERSLPYVAGESVHWVTMEYDALGRTLTEEDESGATTSYEYLGHTLKVTDGNDHTTEYLHNALGQIEQVIDAMGGETAYTYRPFGELHTVTDDDANETEIFYDARGFKTGMNDPDMGSWEYDHNAFGELVYQKDAKDQEVTLEYDDAGRLVSRDEDEGLTEWDYYPYNASAGHAGRLQQVTSPGGLSEVYEYHATHGAVTEITRTIGSATYDLDFGFDTEGRLSQITYPQNVDSQRLAVEYLYDSGGALSQVRNATTTSLVYFTLNEQDGSGATRRATLGNGLVEKYSYEATTGRLASIKTGPSETATLQNLEYEWDLAGNLEERVDQLQSRTEVFDYDDLDRLTGVVRNSSTIFSAAYDALGNITSKTGVSGTFTYGGSRPHAVTSIGSQSFVYDDNGNMTDRNGTELTWASYNLPTRIEAPSGEYSEFLYGADRSRYQQIEGAGALQSTRHYASPGLFEVLTWNSGASRVDYHYIHAGGKAVAQFTTSNVEADELQYLHRDHQGNVVATSDTGGSVLDRFEYDPFGVRTTTVGSDERMHRGYTGHEHLAALDLIHMNGRVQDPLLGRFLSPDPHVTAPYYSQSLNRYSYVWNNPLTLVDPSGFDPDDNPPGPVPCNPVRDGATSMWVCEGPNLPFWVDDNRVYPADGGGGGSGAASVPTPVEIPAAILSNTWQQAKAIPIPAERAIPKHVTGTMRVCTRYFVIGCVIYAIGVDVPLGSGDCIGDPVCEAWLYAEMAGGKNDSTPSTDPADNLNVGGAVSPDPGQFDPENRRNDDVTDRGSRYPNRKIDRTPDEIRQSLREQGFESSRSGPAELWTKGNSRYVIRPSNSSPSGSKIDVYSHDVKIGELIPK
jgi:RHS repeat-associated protein